MDHHQESSPSGSDDNNQARDGAGNENARDEGRSRYIRFPERLFNRLSRAQKDLLAELVTPEMEIERLKGAVHQFCNNLRTGDGWDGTPQYESPEIWTLRGYLEKAAANEGEAALNTAFFEAWDAMKSTVESCHEAWDEEAISDEQREMNAGDAFNVTSLLGQHLLIQSAVSLVAVPLNVGLERLNWEVESLEVGPFRAAVEQGASRLSYLPGDGRLTIEQKDEVRGQIVTSLKTHGSDTLQDIFSKYREFRENFVGVFDEVMTTLNDNFIPRENTPENFYPSMQQGLMRHFYPLIKEALNDAFRENCTEVVAALRGVGALHENEPLHIRISEEGF